MALDQVNKAIETLRGLASRNAVLATRHVIPDGFVLHDPSVAQGVGGMRELAARPAGSDGSLQAVRTIEDGPFVVVHGQAGAAVIFAGFRFDNGLIAEMWRFTAPTAAPNPSGHTQTDGPTHPDGSADTARTKALVRDYYETVHIAGDHQAVDRFMSGDRQIRHEPDVRDGVRAFKHDLEVLTQNRTINDITLLAGQGDFVFVAAVGTHEGQPCVYVDLYRVEAGRLVEHWGFPQAMKSPETGSMSGGLP